jgi:2OG-Fe(II) oxygenase superfamily
MTQPAKHICNINPLTVRADFSSSSPFPITEVKDFIPANLARQLEQELHQIPLDDCKHFTRRDSCMYEHNQVDQTPVARDFINVMHSSRVLKWLEAATGMQKLIPDPHLVGAGYVKSFAGDSLKIHSDFNWVEELGLHRTVSVVIYLNSVWDSTWGGSLNFYQKDRETIIKSICPGLGNAAIWGYSPVAYHGYPEPMTCPEGFCRKALRLFYYTSRAEHDPVDPPHRSLYWFDDAGNPTDDRTQR